MIGKVVTGYMNCLQKVLNPFQVYFDTMYTPDIGDFTSAMSSYNLRQMFDFDKLKAAQVSEELADALRSKVMEGNASYNALQYKYTPLVYADDEIGRMSNTIYDIIYRASKDGVKLDSETSAETIRVFEEYSRDKEMALGAIFEEEHKDLLKTGRVHDVLAGEVVPHESNDVEVYSRLGVFGSIGLECRFLTTNTNIVEVFQILYNAYLMKNPNAVVPLKFGNETVGWGVNVKHEPISSVEQLEYKSTGSIMAISFNVSLTTMFLSPFSKKMGKVNEIAIYTEVRGS